MGTLLKHKIVTGLWLLTILMIIFLIHYGITASHVNPDYQSPWGILSYSTTSEPLANPEITIPTREKP